MRKLVLAFALLTVGLFGTGCNGSEPDPEAAKDKAKHAEANASPAAQSAEAAPSDPSIVYPGAKKKQGGPK